MSRVHIVTIFAKPGCGLCEEAEEVIEAVRARRPFELQRRNILENLVDYEKYKHDIPVILVDGVEIARHHLDPEQFERALTSSPSSPSPGTPGEGWGEGSARLTPSVDQTSTAPNPHPALSRITGRGEEEAVAIVVMAKFPIAGQVKTRLMSVLSPDQAAGVQREFLLHVVGRLAPRRVLVCVDPPASEHDMRRLLEVEVMPQSAGDLGVRLAAATVAARRVSENLIFLGVDSPDVPIKFIDRIAALLVQHDLIIAPAHDGGYWAVALAPRVDAEKLFAGIEWSTGREGVQTLERAKHLGYNVAVADRWPDVDRLRWIFSSSSSG
jgi:uncharacterized protein